MWRYFGCVWMLFIALAVLGGASLSFNLRPIGTALPLSDIDGVLLEVTPNRTYIHVLVYANSSIYTIFWGFEDGIDGFVYIEDDPYDHLYGVWVNDTGYNTWGYVGFIALNVPRSWFDGYYGYQLIYANFTTPSSINSATLSLAYYFWTSDWLVFPVNVSIAIYDWDTESLTIVYTRDLQSSFGSDPFPDPTDWSTINVDLSTILRPSKTYAIVIFAIWYQNPWSYNATLFFDDINITIDTGVYTYSGYVVRGSYDFNGSISVTAILRNLYCNTSNVKIYLETGLERSTPITIDDCNIVTDTTSSVTVSSFVLQRYVKIYVEFEGRKGSYSNVTLDIVSSSNGHVSIEKVRIDIVTP